MTAATAYEASPVAVDAAVAAGVEAVRDPEARVERGSGRGLGHGRRRGGAKSRQPRFLRNRRLG